MLNVRDTYIAEKRRCFYLAVAVAIVEKEQQRLEEAVAQEKATPPRRKESVGQGMVDQKARVWTV